MAIILRPKHINALWQRLPNDDRTPGALRRLQREYLAQNPAASEPAVISEPIAAYISGGAWRIVCPCGEHTHADPEWKLACCFGCGAIYDHVVFPGNWQAIEDLLCKRRVQGTRNWQVPETLEDLIAEQVARGEPV